MTRNNAQILSLFGGDKPWSPVDWTASDDRVRGGKSQSYLDCQASEPTAVFNGTLDIETLGGAGFASQRTTGEDRSWDLSAYDGLLLDIEKSDLKQYTLTLKDELLPRSLNGREQSTVSWEYDFKGQSSGASEQIFLSWDDLKPTYRGREKKDAKPLDLKNIKRISLMMRSFFGTQEGPFSLSIRSISASKKPAKSTFPTPYRDDPNTLETPAQDGFNEKTNSTLPNQQGWLGWLFGSCVVL